MTIQRMDNVGIVVDDLDAAVAFFTELGMELEGNGQIEGLFADRTVGLDGVRSEIAMMRTPDGHGKLELTKYHAPAADRAGPQNPPPNTLGLHRVMFAVGGGRARAWHQYPMGFSVDSQVTGQIRCW
jgi:catechol 2,3-dioxygenase-like lactoylglutathione lyase family enzyme